MKDFFSEYNISFYLKKAKKSCLNIKSKDHLDCAYRVLYRLKWSRTNILFYLKEKYAFTRSKRKKNSLMRVYEVFPECMSKN